LKGEFIWSLTFTDIQTTWSENRATWGKGSIGVLDRIRDIEKQIPFKLKGFHCDSGTEFLNNHLLRYFTDRPKVVSFTRSRPYKRTTMPMSNRKTGHMCANYLAMIVSISMNWCH